MGLTFRQIEAFHAVVSTGSVTRAADVLKLTQPAVSRLIADLETEVGFNLFLRGQRALSPTLKARDLYREVERSFLGMEHIARAVRLLAATDRGQLRLAVVPSLVPQLTRDLIRGFAAENPDVPISLEVPASLDAAELLDTVRCDIGLTNEPVQTRNLESRVIGETTAVCVMGPEHKLARTARPVTLPDLAGQRVVSFMPGAAFRRRVDRLFDEAGIARDVRHEARTTAAASEMAAALGAVAIVPSAVLPADSAAHVVVRPFVPALRSDIVLLTHRNRPLPAAAEAFVAYAEAAARKQSAGRRAAEPRRRRRAS